MWTIDLPIETIHFLSTPDDGRAPDSSVIERQQLFFGEEATHWQGRAAATMTLTTGFDSAYLNQPDIEPILAKLHRLTGRGKYGYGRRVQVNFGHGQERAWWIDHVDITEKHRNSQGRTVSAAVTIYLVQATDALAVYSTPAEVVAIQPPIVQRDRDGNPYDIRYPPIPEEYL